MWSKKIEEDRAFWRTLMMRGQEQEEQLNGVTAARIDSYARPELQKL